MFSLGLEYSLAQLKAMRRAVFGLGFAQVAITTVAGTVALSVAGFGWPAALRSCSRRSRRSCSPRW